MKLSFITGNKSKFEEVRELLADFEVVQLDIDLPELQELDPDKLVREKLGEAFRHTKGDHFFVEDTSLHLDCLNGMPGPFVKWFEKQIGLDGIYGLAKKYDNMNATARTTIGFGVDADHIEVFSGEIRGTIVELAGKNAFGWDPIFIPEGFEKRYAEMSREEKNKISHRKWAFEAFRQYLKKVA